jgi:hypothetical protein
MPVGRVPDAIELVAFSDINDFSNSFSGDEKRSGEPSNWLAVFSVIAHTLDHQHSY